MAATCAEEEEAGCNMSNLPASYVTLLLHMAIWSAGCPTDIISAIVGGVRGNCAPDLSLLAITFVAIITTVPFVPSEYKNGEKEEGKQGIEINQFLERPESTMTFE